MRIDIHGHFTTAPPALDAFRGRQLGYLNKPQRFRLKIADELVDEALQKQLTTMDERGIDHLIFSPRASGMGHNVGDHRMSLYWAEVNNDLIRQACDLYPQRFSPVCQLPQSPGRSPAEWLGELTRCVEELDFVGCNINPDISGGVEPFTPSLGDEYWYPLWERMVELDVPGMVHASATYNPAFHINGAHYIAWDYTSVVELCASKVFENFPTLRLIIPHGGGGIPYQLNRHRALHVAQGLPPFEEVVKRLYFDTTLYDGDSLALMIGKLGSEHVLFGTEMFGTANALDPLTQRGFDDVVPLLESIPTLSSDQLEDIWYRNARTVYPRLKLPTPVDAATP